MSDEPFRTPNRVLIIGSRAFAGIDSITWGEQVVPNIPDYDLVVVSVPDIAEDFLKSVKADYLEKLRKALVRFLDSGGKVVALVSATFGVNRPKSYPERVSNTDWCPVSYTTVQEAGESIVRKGDSYGAYLNVMTSWQFVLDIRQSSLTKELVNFYGQTQNTRYTVDLHPYLENRYGRVLAGYFNVEVRRQRTRTNDWNVHKEYPDKPDVTTGTVVLLPLFGKFSAEEALAKIIEIETGICLGSPEPEWAQAIYMPGVPALEDQIEDAKAVIAKQNEFVGDLEARIADINSYRRLLYGSGPELETIVKRSLENLGAVVSPSKYGQEEYILEFNGQEFLMEVKGVAKSIALTHVRQLSDYMLRYEEETGKKCKGILFGNAWRNLPPEERTKGDTQEFPANVVDRAVDLGISLVSSTAFFEAFCGAIDSAELKNALLVKITSTTGVVQF
jgi:hypothetical protein